MQQKSYRTISLTAITSSLFALAFALTAFSPASKLFSFKSIERYPTGHADMPALRLSGQLQTTPETWSRQPVVRMVMFWMEGCPHCHEVLENTLPALQDKYGTQIEILLLEVVSMDDVNRLFEVAALYDIPREQAEVPFLIIGDHALIGSRQIPEGLPGLIEYYLAQGGVDWPSIPDNPSVAKTTDNDETAPVELHSNGFAIAIAIMALMLAALIYSIIAFTLGKIPSLPDWAAWLFPFLILIGLGVAGYLSYVEIQMVDAVCSPVGDCNSVQSSPYARLFGVLPIGVLGMVGYLVILVAWLYQRLWHNRIATYLPILVFGMAFFGVLFSLYLTYLEPFVIRAVCIWCLTSATIMTSMLLLSLKPALQALQVLQTADLTHTDINLETPPK